jgi:hypothetical protein
MSLTIVKRSHNIYAQSVKDYSESITPHTIEFEADDYKEGIAFKQLEAFQDDFSGQNLFSWIGNQEKI